MSGDRKLRGFFEVTGDPETDKYILEKVAEDYRRPPTTFTKKLEGANDEPVLGFKGPYRFLSNFWYSPVVALGMQFPSVEHAYQAAKRPEDRELHIRLLPMDPGTVKSVMKQVPITAEDWDSVTKFQVMRHMVEQKFCKHEDLMWMLLGTGRRHLEEVNDWGDRVWGTDANNKLHPVIADITGTVYDGKNELGKILMEVRHLLKLSIAGQTRVFEREDLIGSGTSYYQ